MKYSILVLGICAFLFSNAQSKDSLTAAQKDSIKMEQLFSRASYPLIKTSKWTGVLPMQSRTREVRSEKAVCQCEGSLNGSNCALGITPWRSGDAPHHG